MSDNGIEEAIAESEEVLLSPDGHVIPKTASPKSRTTCGTACKPASRDQVPIAAEGTRRARRLTPGAWW
jgi:hypothetical protein